MKISSLSLLKACTLSVALLGSAAIVAAVSLPDAAFAKQGNDSGGGKGNGGGNGNGNGGGNGNGNGNGGGNGNGNGGGNGNSGNAKAGGAAVEKADGAKTKAKATTKTAKKKSLADELGVSPSELGALNAARANPNALANASPNSRVGKIAAYRDAVLAGQALQADLDEQTARLEGLTPPARPSTDVVADLTLAADDTDGKAATVAQLEADLAAAGGTDAAIEAALSTARDELATAEATEAALQDEYDAALEYETVSANVDELTQQVADQPAVERDLLEAAANKPVTDAVEDAVRKLLGL